MTNLIAGCLGVGVVLLLVGWSIYYDSRAWRRRTADYRRRLAAYERQKRVGHDG